jgi:2-C-methyl-D-erythritol 2,4-cyclodiphosphate synthase
MIRIGHGYDVHRLVPERRLIIGGVEIQHELGLLGHSDADVLLHAICDAVLGALGAGDIGRHFPDSDPAYKGIDSRKLLGHVIDLASQRGYQVSNIDATVIAEQPKLAPYIKQMVARIADDCKIETDRVNVKATTTEGLGFAGQKEGIAAHAVVLLQSTEWAWRDFV